ncbi:hypothetical protein Btru_025567 [Bulinus truncatus]|nr:hypothetical protein Btru_025567 [Bulinus truncatus]
MKRVQINANTAHSADNLKDEISIYDVLCKAEDEKQRYETIDIVEGKPTISRSAGDSGVGAQNPLAEILQSQKQILAEMTSLRLENHLLRETLTSYREQQDRMASSVQDQMQKAADHQNGQLAALRRELDTALNVSLFGFLDKQEKFTLSVHDQLAEIDDRLNEKLININKKLKALMLNKPVYTSAAESSSANDGAIKKPVKTKKKSPSDLPAL